MTDLEAIKNGNFNYYLKVNDDLRSGLISGTKFFATLGMMGLVPDEKEKEILKAFYIKNF